MGIKFHTGFGHYSTLTNRFDSTSGSTWGATSGRDNTAGVVIDSNAVAGVNRFCLKNLPANMTTIYYATAFKPSGFPSTGDSTVMALLDNGTQQVSLHIRADGKFQFYRNTTALGTPSNTVISPGIWYSIEIKVVIDNSSGSIDLRINEVQDTNFPQTGIDTQNTANAYCTQISINNTANSSLPNHSFDDVIVRDDEWSGDLKVKAFFPIGVGSTNSWSVVGASSSWQATDETAPNSDTDYISSSTIGDQTLFTFDTLPTSSVIHAVTPIPWVEKTDAGTAQFASEIRLSSTTYTGATQAASDSSYTYFPDVNMTSPATGVTWTVSEWNSIEIGVVRTA